MSSTPSALGGMVRIRTTMLGNGTVNDPYHANFPHYQTVSCDYDSREMIIEIPLNTVPESLLVHPDTVTAEVEHYASVHGRSLATYHKDYGTEGQVSMEHSNVISDVHPEQMAEWHKLLDNRYREHAGKFRHDVR